MLNYLKKFESLPVDLRKKVSNKEVVDKISQLESKYKLDLVSLIIKIIIKEVPWDSLVYYLMEDFFVDLDVAENLKKDLADKVFYNIADYLGIEESKEKIQEGNKDKKFLPEVEDEKRLPSYKHNNEELDLVKKSTQSNFGAVDESKKKGSVESDLGMVNKSVGGVSGTADESLTRDSKEKDLPSVFSPEEQEEIREIASSMNKEGEINKNERNEELNEILEKIIKESELSFSSQASEDRFRKILLTYLKGIRNKAKTKYTLSKDFDKGGLGLGEKVVDDTVLLSDKYHNSLKDKEKENEKSSDKLKTGEKDKTRQNRKDSIFDFDEEVDLGGPDLPSKNYYNKPDEEINKGEGEKKGLDLKNMPNRDIEYDLSSLKKSPDNSLENKEKENKIKVEKTIVKDLSEEETKGESEKEEKKEFFDKVKTRKESAQSAFGAADESLTRDLKEDESEYDLGEILKRSLEEKEDSSTISTGSRQAGSGQGEKKRKSSQGTSGVADESLARDSKEKEESVKKVEENNDEKNKNKDDNLNKKLKEKGEKEIDNKEKNDLVSNFFKEEDNTIKRDKKIKREGESVFGFKKKIKDIKKPPKLLNPISELKYMDLFTFRRLGDNPKKRIEKIKEKISNLEKKFFYRKVQGVQAWRQSPVNRIYLNMGNESIVYSKSIDDIIKERKRKNKDYLEKDEFESIMDLNNDLKYY